MSIAAVSPAAQVYARALFDAAGDSAESVLETLSSLETFIDEQPDEWALLINPNVPSAGRKAAIDKLLSADPMVRNLLYLLVDKHRLEQLPEVVAAFRELVRASQRQADVTVTSAFELPEELATKLQQRLRDLTGNEVRLHSKIDPTIIGGLIVQHGDRLIDTSIRGRLDGLRTLLRHGHLN